jgi:hypothetical protein
MDQNTTIDKIWEYAKCQKLVFEGKREEYLQLFAQLYAAGFDTGRKQSGYNNKKKVIQMDKYGNIINEFESCIKAAISVGVDKTSISKACLGRTASKIKGYYWRYKHLKR